jgi:hypothetical protein
LRRQSRDLEAAHVQRWLQRAAATACCSQPARRAVLAGSR